jgi:hypothetical protein
MGDAPAPERATAVLQHLAHESAVPERGRPDWVCAQIGWLWHCVALATGRHVPLVTTRLVEPGLAIGKTATKA